MPVAVFEHPPGRGGRTESYIIGPLQDLLANIEWGEKKLGNFVDVVPEWEGCPTDPFFVLILSFSLQNKAAQAKAARDELKRLLPGRLHRLVTLARRINARPKRHLLPLGVTKSKRTKAELFIQEVLSDEDRQEIEKYMDCFDFWRAATGRVEPNQVEKLMKVKQLELNLG
jgi:hypothetical protein